MTHTNNATDLTRPQVFLSLCQCDTPGGGVMTSIVGVTSLKQHSLEQLCPELVACGRGVVNLLHVADVLLA